MLRHVLRRLLWILPIVLGITLAAFLVLSYVPDPADDPRLAAVLDEGQVLELRRSRFLDLPRFFNGRPTDLRARVDEAVFHLAADDAESATGRDTLDRLGGAALPYLLPRLDAFEPVARARVTRALAPLATRMGILADESADPPSVTFWNRFWADRSIDFRPANAKRATKRLAMHATSMREANLVELDTYGLEEIMGALDLAVARREVETMRRLLEVAAHVTGRADSVAEGATLGDAFSCADRWQDWWLVHRADYLVYDGPARVAAMLLDTQYARWAERFIVRRLGGGLEGSPLLERLRERAPRTLLLIVLSAVLAYAVAVPLGVLSAVRRDRTADFGIFAATLAAYAVPTACLAAALAARFAQVSSLLAPVLSLACALVISPVRQQRSALLEILHRDYVRTARAMGVPPLRLVMRHALRSSLLPLVALFSVEMPSLVGGAFVVEKAFGIQGLGEETVRAVQKHDIVWLMTLAIAAALAGSLISLLSELAVVAIDPRLRAMTFRRRRVYE